MSRLLALITCCGIFAAQGFQLLRESFRQVKTKSPDVARRGSPEKKARRFGATGFINATKSLALVVCKQCLNVALYDVKIRCHWLSGLIPDNTPISSIIISDSK